MGIEFKSQALSLGFLTTQQGQVSAQFGVPGKPVNSNLIIYDRKSDSYRPQIMGRAITGPARGIALEEFPVVRITWEKWKSEHPDTLVLSRDTGFFRN
ncbi:MAG: DUF3179 domain-containing protein [Actinobacteria bacterium]|nr:DUF3179 domain-containing protein [Actinomycetota bacterium]